MLHQILQTILLKHYRRYAQAKLRMKISKVLFVFILTAPKTDNCFTATRYLHTVFKFYESFLINFRLKEC